MIRTISIIRTLILFTLCLTGVVLLFCEEQDENQLVFIIHAIFDKAIAMESFYTMVRLCKRWNNPELKGL